VPLVAVTVEGQRQELVSIRASIWRTARTRYNIHLTSRWWDGKLWVRTHPG